MRTLKRVILLLVRGDFAMNNKEQETLQALT